MRSDHVDRCPARSSTRVAPVSEQLDRGLGLAYPNRMRGEKKAKAIFLQVAEALRAAGWKVTARRGSREGYYTTPAGRESTIKLYAYSARTWRWSIDNRETCILRRGEAVRPTAPPFGHPDTELSFAPEELEVIAGWLPGWMVAREAGGPLPDLPVPWQRRKDEGPGTAFEGAYAWTVAGNAAYAAEEAERQRRR